MPQTGRIIILIVVSIFLVAWAALTLVIQRRFVRLLKTNQPKLWMSLWDPAASPLLQLRYSHWFWTGGFDRTWGPATIITWAKGVMPLVSIPGGTFGLWVVSRLALWPYTTCVEGSSNMSNT